MRINLSNLKITNQIGTNLINPEFEVAIEDKLPDNIFSNISDSIINFLEDNQLN